MPPLSPTTTISAQRGQGKVCPPPICPPPPLFMHKQDTNMGLCRTSPTPFVPAPPFTQTGVHRMRHAPLLPATPISAQRGHRKGTPTPLLPSLRHHSCANRTQMWVHVGHPPSPLCALMQMGVVQEGASHNPLCRDGQGSPASALGLCTRDP